ncbi:MAG TPA: hypothetical protein VFG09_02135, partial [Thermodesulfovibrionales bacterium]|nr:hypothetical protein [Thermodesulfovibrionales bacterium]
KVRLLNVRKVDLILQDGNGIELHRKSYYFGSKGTNLTPDESKEFTMSYWVPTGFLRDVRKLSAGLAYEFKVQEEKQ